MELKIRIKPLLLFLFIASILSSSVYAQSTLKKLRQQFDNNHIFFTAFNHTYLDSYTNESTHSGGQFWLNTHSYKLTGEHQTIVVDGENSYVYDVLRNRVIISEYDADEDDFGILSRLLSEEDEEYTATEEQLKNGNTLITLTTTDDFATYTTIEIEVDTTNQPITIIAYDIADNIITTTFNQRTFSTADDTIFEFTYPKDAEIIDMRY